MIDIQRNIAVVDDCGNALESTYSKRARQLVKQQRATWIDEDVIQLQSQLGKDFVMDTITKNIDKNLKEAQDTKDYSDSVLQDNAENDAIMDLAKERLQAKQVLIRQGLDLALLTAVLLALSAIQGDSERLVVAFMYGLFWLVRYAIRVVKFAKPSFKGGVSDYMKRRKETKLNAEYNKIKALIEMQQAR